MASGYHFSDHVRKETQGARHVSSHLTEAASMGQVTSGLAPCLQEGTLCRALA
jgi:hypothetical protein